MKQLDKLFTKFATRTSDAAGQPVTFIAAVGIIIVWALLGPITGLSDTWQLVINTSTTIITFLMVFLIQNTQNRDNVAINLKLDAIMKELGIGDDLVALEDKSQRKIKKKKQQVNGRKHGKSK